MPVRGRQSGISLTETMIAMALSGMVITGALRMYQLVNRTQFEAREVAAAQHELKVITGAMRKALHPAGYGLDDRHEGLTVTTDTVQVKYVDEFGRHGCMGGKVTVRFVRHSDSTFWMERDCGGALSTVKLSENVDLFEPSGLDTAGAVAGTPAEVATIEARVSVGTAKSGIPRKSREADIRVTPGNFALGSGS